MKHLFISILVSGCIANAAYANEPLNVFACEPEWASLARELGGTDINVTSATTAHQDPHHIRAKPSLIAAMRKADMLVCTGAELEIGWLPVLMEKAGNAKLQPGMPAYLTADTIVPMLERPSRLDRSDGDVHPQGNPHLQLNPHNIALVAKALNDRFQAVDPAHAQQYQARYDAFNTKWNAAMQRWEQEGTVLKGLPVVVHHKSFTYLLNWLGMEEEATLEVKPGIPPTTEHLESLLLTLKAKPAKVIIRTPYEPEDASKWLAGKTHIPEKVLPFTVGGDDASPDLFGLFDETLKLLLEATNAHHQ